MSLNVYLLNTFFIKSMLYGRIGHNMDITGGGGGVVQIMTNYGNACHGGIEYTNVDFKHRLMFWNCNVVTPQLIQYHEYVHFIKLFVKTKIDITTCFTNFYAY